jgi:hypothetical protein
MAAIELPQFLESPQFTEACQNILGWPDGLGAGDIRERFSGRENCAMLIGTTTANIGVMSSVPTLPILVVNNLIGASTALLWCNPEHRRAMPVNITTILRPSNGFNGLRTSSKRAMTRMSGRFAKR